MRKAPRELEWVVSLELLMRKCGTGWLMKGKWVQAVEENAINKNKDTNENNLSSSNVWVRDN